MGYPWGPTYFTKHMLQFELPSPNVSYGYQHILGKIGFSFELSPGRDEEIRDVMKSASMSPY